MSDNIYEMAQKMTDLTLVQNDMNEAAEMVRQMFREKYLNKLQSAITSCHTNCMQNPSKEVQLLSAFKPFVPAEQSNRLDQLIDMMLLMNTAGAIREELQCPASYPGQPGCMGEQFPVRNPGFVSGTTSPWMPGSRPNGRPNGFIRTAEYSGSPDSVHEDGVYDLDQTCLHSRSQTPPNFPSLLCMLALMMR